MAKRMKNFSFGIVLDPYEVIMLRDALRAVRYSEHECFFNDVLLSLKKKIDIVWRDVKKAEKFYL